MKFRTEVALKPKPNLISHQTTILTVGSCFSNNIGTILSEQGFELHKNPLGILFNPYSILKSLHNALISEVSENGIIEREGVFFHYDYHSSITGNSKNQLITEIKKRQAKVKTELIKGNRLIITFGTSWVYRESNTNEIVANCHKIPQKNFQKERLGLEELKTLYHDFILDLKHQNPKIELILTVSPVRHIRNGLPENNLSKAVLLLLASHLENIFSFVHYFPSYELIIDDLRDYRFYESDMIHPNQQAIDYVYTHFSDAYFSSRTREIAKLSDQIRKAKNHQYLNATERQKQMHETKISEMETRLNQLKIKT